MTVEESRHQAIALHREGRLDEAVTAYRALIEAGEGDAHLLYLIGVALHSKQAHEEAAKHLQEAVRLNPSHAPSACCLGHALSACKRVEEAAGAYRLALHIQEDYLEAALHLTKALHLLNEPVEALTVLETIAHHHPTNAALLIARADALLQCKRFEECLSLGNQLLPQVPNHADLLMIVAEAAYALQDFAQSEKHYRALLTQRPDDPLLHFALGKIFFRQQKHHWALGAMETAMKHGLDLPEGHFMLGKARCAIRQSQPALDALEQYRAQGGKEDEEFLYYYGESLSQAKRYREAIIHLQKAIVLKEDYVYPYISLGKILRQQKRFKHAVETLLKANALQPKNFETLVSLSNAYREFKSENKSEHMAKSLDYAKEALDLKPQDPAARFNMANVYMDMGMPEQSIEHYRVALENDVANPGSESSCCFNSNYLHDIDTETLFQQHKRWGDKHVRPLMDKAYTHINPPEPERKIRVGFISPDFCVHPVAYFFKPVFDALDRDSLELYLYYNNYDEKKPDGFTKAFMQGAHSFEDIAKISHKDLADKIHAHQLDILIDLAGHSCGHKLLAMGFRPAPIQATWLGYPNTTGSPAIDYRIVDQITDPPEHQAISTEKLLHLPTGFNCYRMPYAFPEVSEEPPFVRNGYITFGSFNNSCKHNHHVLRFWARLLSALPETRLALKDKFTEIGLTRDYILRQFASEGVEADRIRFLDFTHTNIDHLKRYAEIDIALDPTPYNGTTTSCEALLMGVPILTLLGERHAARVTASILHRLEMDDWVATDEAAFIELARQKIADRDTLIALRKSLRERMLTSPVCDAPRFAREFESSLRKVWEKWCQEQAPHA